MKSKQQVVFPKSLVQEITPIYFEKIHTRVICDFSINLSLCLSLTHTHTHRNPCQQINLLLFEPHTIFPYTTFFSIHLILYIDIALKT